MTTLSFFAGLTTLIVFTLYIFLKYGIQPSFSDSYYALEKDKKGKGILFTITMVAMTFFFAVPMLEISAGQWWQFISFFAIAPIAFVGVAARFREGGLTKETHMKAAKMSALFSFIWVVLCGICINWVVLLTIPVSVALMAAIWLLSGRTNKVWWAEYACFVWTITTIDILLP